MLEIVISNQFRMDLKLSQSVAIIYSWLMMR